MRYAIDVSHHQNPASLPWDRFAGSVHAVIARACYGSELRDRAASEHIRRARGIGALVGLYMFFRPSQPVAKQFDVFRSVAEQVGLSGGDIVPALDVEADPFPAPGSAVSTAWAGPVRELAERLDEWSGAKCMPYITQREWAALGKPAWMLEADRPIWVAHYTGALVPATPGGRAFTIWQHRVGPFVPGGAGGYVKAHPDLDQNRVPGELPLIGATPAISDHHPETEDHADDGFDEARDEFALADALASAETSIVTWLDEEAHAPRGNNREPIA